MPLTPDHLTQLASPDSAKAALAALTEGGAADLSIGQLASAAGVNLPETADLSAWTAAATDAASGTPLLIAGIVAVCAGAMLWILGERALRGIGIVVFGLLGMALGAAGEMLTSGVFGPATIGAAAVGSLAGLCLGALAVGLLSRSICMFTGASTGVLAAMLLAASPLSLPTTTASLGHDNQPSQASQPTSSRLLTVAGPESERVQARIDELSAKLDRLERERQAANGDPPQEAAASTSPLQTLVSSLPASVKDRVSSSPAAPSTLLAGSAIGAGAGLVLSMVMGRWSRRLAAASLGAAIFTLGSLAVLIELDSATMPSSTTLAGSWIGLALLRSFVPGRAKPSQGD